MGAETIQTGIDSIGDIPITWRLERLNNVAELFGRIGWQGLTSDEYTDEGAFLVTGTDFLDGYVNWDSCVHVSEERWEEAWQIKLHEGDLLITKDGTVGKLAIVKDLPGHASLNSGLMRIVPRADDYDTKFLYYVLQTDVFTNWYRDIDAGASTIKHLFQGDFIHFVFPSPPRDEQTEIANKLDMETKGLDRAISIVEQQAILLETYRKSLIQEVVTHGLDPDVEMKPSGIDWIGDIPAHWQQNKLRNVCSRIFDGPFGSNLTGDDYSDEGIRVVRLENLRYLNFDISKESYVTEDKYRTISAHTVYPQDLIMATFVEDDISVCILPTEIGFAVNKSDCVGIRLFDESQRDYLHYYLSSSGVWQFLRSMLHGATRGRVNTMQIKQIPILFPPADEQKAIVAYLDEKMMLIDRLIDGKRKQLETLRAQRHSLIYEYVTGKRRVV